MIFANKMAPVAEIEIGPPGWYSSTLSITLENYVKSALNKIGPKRPLFHSGHWLHFSILFLCTFARITQKIETLEFVK